MWHVGTRGSSGLSRDGGTVGLGLRGLFHSKQLSDPMVKWFCNALRSVLVPPAAPVTHFLLPCAAPRAPSPRSPPQPPPPAAPLCPWAQTGWGEHSSPAWDSSFSARVSSQQLENHPGAVPDPHPPQAPLLVPSLPFVLAPSPARGWTVGNSLSVVFRISFEPLCPTEKLLSPGTFLSPVRSRCVSCRVETSPGVEVAQGEGVLLWGLCLVQ